MDPTTSHVASTPLILFVEEGDQASDPLGDILRRKGHVVLRSTSGAQAIDLTRKVSPDAILADFDLPDLRGGEFVRALMESTVRIGTPVLLLTSTPLGRGARLEALSAGAWDILTRPVDPNELILRLDTFIRSKQEADRVRDEGLLDPATGVYNVRGVLKKAREVTADVVRSSRPLSCVAFGVSESGENDSSFSANDMDGSLAAALTAVTRLSDTIGKLGPGEYVVLAPGTDEGGALRLADRVLASLREVGSADGVEPRIRAGLAELGHKSARGPEDLLLHATMALRKAQAEAGSFRVRAYDA